MGQRSEAVMSPHRPEEEGGGGGRVGGRGGGKAGGSYCTFSFPGYISHCKLDLRAEAQDISR